MPLPRPLALALLVALASAGCLGAAVDPAAQAAPAPDFVPGPDAFVHDAQGVLPVRATLAAAVHDTGYEAFEPTLGVNADGTLFYAAYDGGLSIGVTPVVLRSRDQGATWEDVSPRLPTGHPAPPETNDPFLYLDPDTGRVFQFAMAPILTCSVLSWSDDEGETWTTNPRGCGTTPPWDHQSMVAAKPRASTTQGYANVLVQCTNQGVASWCARSLDGGSTWIATVPIPWAGCHGLHGHPVSAPDGTIYLPKDLCGESAVAISRDDGLTWRVVTVSNVATQDWSDPAMAVDAAGNVYHAFIERTGKVMLSVSTDGGSTWSTPVVASPPGVTGHMPALAAGDAGRIVLAYPGTADLPSGYQSSGADQDKARWNGYMTVSVDATAANPTFETVRVNDAADPLVRGRCGPDRCPGMVDFIDVVVGPDGRAYAAFVDTCFGKCATPQGTARDSTASQGVVAALTAGPLLRGP